MKEKLMKLLKAKQDARAAKMKEVDKATEVSELRALQASVEAIDEEIRNLQSMIDKLSEEGDDGQSERTLAVNGEIPGIVVANKEGQEARKDPGKEMETRLSEIAEELRSGKEVTLTREVQEFLEQRAVATTNIMLENKYKRGVADNFNQVAQTIDLVDAFSLEGGNSYEVAFQITDGDADYTAEADVYTNDEGTFGTNSTGRAKITNSAIVNEEVIELPNADYLNRIVNSVRKSIRKKMSNQIIAGLGGANQLKGIYSSPATVMPLTYKAEISAIDADTLRTIVFAYGADEDVESPATLFLNKADLAAFAAVKASDGRPYYKISYDGASGVIEEEGLRVPYTINSACNALSADATVVGTMTMIYGAPTNYELPMFSPLTIKRSDDRYIEKGQVGFFGKVIAGGVVNKYKGFLPVEKVAAV